MNFKKRDEDEYDAYISYLCDKYDNTDINIDIKRLNDEDVRNNEDLYSYIVHKNDNLEIVKSSSYYLDYDDVVIDYRFKKYEGVMPSYDLDGNMTEVPATYGFIDMKDDDEYWINVLEWDFVKKNKKLSGYIRYKLNLIPANNTIFLKQSYFEEGGIFSKKENYLKLMENLLSCKSTLLP